jgi:hypothetical protein
MFLDSTMRLLSYETMLNNVLTGSEEGDVKLDHRELASWTPVASLSSATTYMIV